MEDKETSKARRPLPTPVPPQRPSTPTISPAKFYGNPAPPLPTRPQGVGTSHTTTNFIREEPPSYSSDYREPELVAEDQIAGEELSVVGSNEWNNHMGHVSYEDASTWNTTEANWNTKAPPPGWTPTLWPTPQDSFSGSWYDPYHTLITGRNTYEETNWWDSSFKKLDSRPGSGMLPPVVVDHLHDSDHALYTVIPSVPQLQPSSQSEDHSTQASSVEASSSPPRRIKSPPPPPPTEEEVNDAIPHPLALYCPKENGWVLLHCSTTTDVPPLARSFTASEHSPLPERKDRKNCLDEAENNLRGMFPNKTHHFHRYESAVDAQSLKRPFKKDEWETIETVKLKRRAGKIITEELDLEKMKAAEDDEEEVEEEGKLLDLYVCCQCSFTCISSSVIPGVIPRPVWIEFIKDKKANPVPGKTPDLSVVIALETLLMAIENKLWKGESRRLRVTRQGFQNKMGWNPIVQRVFHALGFHMETLDTEDTLSPPLTQPSDPQGKQNRAKLLRAWLEISAWLKDFINNHPSIKSHKLYPLSVEINNAKEQYQVEIGADPESMPRVENSDWNPDLDFYFKCLGLTPSTFTPELLIFAYLAQCRCDPKNTMWYFTALRKIQFILYNCPVEIPELIAYERSRDRFDQDDVSSAAEKLGFGEENRLRVPYDPDVPEEFIVGAWKDCLKVSWTLDTDSAQQMQKDALDSLRIIAEHRRSSALRKLWEENKDLMTPDRAYETLEVPKEVDDQMLLTIYNMRVEDQPLQISKMRTALEVIAQVRNSDRLRQFLESGQDPGDPSTNVGADWPRGLNQLGNTCYLNSLLQYFNTIKDLREAVLSMRHIDVKSLEDDKLTDDDLKRHRVGGRLVTRREIQRSKRFVHQLAELFYNLEYSETVSVTPSIELAKLALVTSKDEEDDETDKGGTDSSNDTDATLVDDAPSGYSTVEKPPQSPTRVPDSVLGKRSRTVQPASSAMDVDNKSTFDKDDSPPPLISVEEETSSSHGRDHDGDVVMRSSTPAPKKTPPLPPRKPQNSDSVMMFGKQHDVAECMDNCMFQIETALLKFDGMEDAEGSEKRSVVKRLFYGKTRQQLLIAPDPNKSRTPLEPKVELFNHLPVNVDEEGFDIYDALGRYFDDIVDYEGQRVPMQLALIDLPPLLQIQLQRVQFDRESLQSWKSQAYIKFEDTIYLDRFMDSADPQLRTQSKLLQEELNSCRERIRVLTRTKDGPSITALNNTCDFLSHADLNLPFIDEQLIFELQEEQSLIQTELDELRTRMGSLKAELEAIWQNHRQVPYELTSVFIHRGTSASWGHYFFYSRHLPEYPDAWFKYNDSEVSKISKEEVLVDTTGSTANPYLLVFARKGSDVVDTVKRYEPKDLDLEIEYQKDLTNF